MAPIRRIIGAATGLAWAVEVALDPVANEIFVSCQGNFPVTPAGIRVFQRTANGNAAPVRTIAGPATKIGTPYGILLDRPHNEGLLTAREGAISVFARTANGNVAPLRTIKGPTSLIRNPTGVAIDPQNDELWVSNFGNHSATVYKTNASGDVAPLRVIRSAPIDTPSPIIGNPGSVAYDSKRDELLVPN